MNKFDSGKENFAELNRVLYEAQELTRCRIHLMYQAQAGGYLWVSLSVAGTFMLICSLVLSRLSVESSSLFFMLQLVPLVVSFALIECFGLSPRFAPEWLRRSLATRTLQSQRRKMSSAELRDAVVVLVSEHEKFVAVVPSQSLRARVPQSVWDSIETALLIDVGHGQSTKGLRNSTSALVKLLQVYFPSTVEKRDKVYSNRLDILA